MTRIALLQMTSGIDPEENLNTICDALTEARDGGAAVLFTPEMSLLLDRNRERAAPRIQGETDSSVLNQLCAQVSARKVWLALGSMAVRRQDGRLANRSFVISPQAGVVARYDKIHMFDVALANGESWRESAAYAPGKAVVTAQTPLGRVGLTVCYDIRFPALFEALGRELCDLIAIPAAFTVPTGEAHWHLLQRARAVEASAYVVSAAQVGEHPDGRRTYGHSLVVDPWGEVVLDMGGKAPGLAFAEIEPARTAQVREELPSLANRRAIATSPRA